MSNQIFEIITQNKLFKDIKEDEINLQVDSEKLLYKQAGDIIYGEGDPAEEIYLVVSGEVRLIKERLLGEAKKIVIKPTDFFGEEDFLENMPHTSIAYAHTDCRLFTLCRSEIDSLRKKNLTIFKNLRNASKEREVAERSEISTDDLDIEIDNIGLGEKDDLAIENENNENINRIETISDSEIKVDTNEPKEELKSSILEEVKSILGKVKLFDLVNSIRESAKRLTNAEEVLIYLSDKNNNEIKANIYDGNNYTEIRLKKGQGIAGLVADTNQVINIENIESDKRFAPNYDGIGSLKVDNLLCLPIINKVEEVIGVYYLVNSKQGKFTRFDEEIINEFSPYVTQMLEIAHAFENVLLEEKNSLIIKMSNFINREVKKPVLVSKRFAEHLKSKNLSQDINQTLDMQLEQLNFISDIIQSTSNYCEEKPNLQLTKCKLNDSLNEILDKLDSGITIRNCQVERKFDNELMINLDKKEFYFVCFHILRNACDAMPNGGRIVISTVPGFNDVTITFKDNGQGVPLEIIDQIFSPFFSFGRKEGSGLGLAVVKRIIENHKGKITVESNPGEGTAFIITLPIL
jgi:putative methionine-R-sulfoxide reductase with GAF domain